MAVSRAVKLEGMQIRNFSAGAVRSSRAIDLFYRHLRAGTLEAHLQAQPLWWHAVLDPRLPAGWKDLYRRQPHFRRWERDHPPTNAAGPPPPPAAPPGPPPGPPPPHMPPSQPSQPPRQPAAPAHAPPVAAYAPPPAAHVQPPAAAAVAPPRPPPPAPLPAFSFTLCVKGCAPRRPAKPGEYRPGRRWDSCCMECATGRGYHSQECEQRFAQYNAAQEPGEVG